VAKGRDCLLFSCISLKPFPLSSRDSFYFPLFWLCDRLPPSVRWKAIWKEFGGSPSPFSWKGPFQSIFRNCLCEPVFSRSFLPPSSPWLPLEAHTFSGNVEHATRNPFPLDYPFSGVFVSLTLGSSPKWDFQSLFLGVFFR